MHFTVRPVRPPRPDDTDNNRYDSDGTVSTLSQWPCNFKHINIMHFTVRQRPPRPNDTDNNRGIVIDDDGGDMTTIYWFLVAIGVLFLLFGIYWYWKVRSSV
jgi:hypothetical protein